MTLGVLLVAALVFWLMVANMDGNGRGIALAVIVAIVVYALLRSSGRL